MEQLPKRRVGRPNRKGPPPTRVTVFVPADIANDLIALARETDRSISYWGTRFIQDAIRGYRRDRAIELKRQVAANPRPAPIIAPERPVLVVAPTETADELIKAAALELENKPLPPIPQPGNPDYKEKI
jgi:hypothetical protein